ncbi:TetR/AcrR family transcriptional regulator [Streptomyces sp. NPDC002990]
MSPKQQRGEATVDLLLTTALRVYAAAGPQGFTVNAVVAASGVSLGSLYHHFGSFGGLVAALHIRCMEELYEEMTAALRRTRTARTGIRALVTAYLRFTRDHRDSALFLHACAYSGYLAAHGERIGAAEAAASAVMTEWMRARVECGEIAALPGSLLEVLVVGPPREASHRWLSSTCDIDLDQAARLLPDLIWRSLRPA